MAGTYMARNLLALVEQGVPEGGRIAIGSEQTGLTAESLTWVLQYKPALQGKQGNYEFDNFLAADGKFSRKSLANARGILVFLNPGLQYSPDVQLASINLVQFCGTVWTKEGLARVGQILSPYGDTVACLVVIKEPLDDAHITELIAGTHAAELKSDDNFGVQTDRRLSWKDVEDVLARWKEKRFGP